MQREKKLLFILLFIVASFVTALHELSPNHHAESCQVCVVDNHTLSFDIVVPLKGDEPLYHEAVTQLPCNFFSSFAQHYCQSRAPPLFS